MSDLAVVFHRDGVLRFERSFDVGAGPSVGVEDVLRELGWSAEEGELDAALVERVSWLADWEGILFAPLYGEAPREGWIVEDGAEDLPVSTAVATPEELARIRAAMDALRPAVAALGARASASWDALATFLRECVDAGGTVCLYYDLEG